MNSKIASKISKSTPSYNSFDEWNSKHEEYGGMYPDFIKAF